MEIVENLALEGFSSKTSDETCVRMIEIWRSKKLSNLLKYLPKMANHFRDSIENS